jgi:hypothetical protein
MKILPIEIKLNNESEFMGEKCFLFSISIFKFEYSYKREKELLGFFYNDGTIIITLFFKEFVSRWNQ